MPLKSRIVHCSGGYDTSICSRQYCTLRNTRLRHFGVYRCAQYIGSRLSNLSYMPRVLCRIYDTHMYLCLHTRLLTHTPNINTHTHTHQRKHTPTYGLVSLTGPAVDYLHSEASPADVVQQKVKPCTRSHTAITSYLYSPYIGSFTDTRTNAHFFSSKLCPNSFIILFLLNVIDAKLFYYII